jgi:hypothetical protein
MELDTKTYWLTDRQSQYDFDFDLTVSQLVDSCSSWGRGNFGNPEEGEREPLKGASKQRSEDRDWDH